MNVNWNNVLLWFAIVVLFFLMLRPREISNYEGSNTIFDLNELSWIPDPIRSKLKNGVNDIIISNMKTMMTNFWNSLTEVDKTEILNAIDLKIRNEVENANEDPPTKEKILKIFSSSKTIGESCFS